MKTDVIKVFSDGKGREDALKETVKFAQYNEYNDKQARRLRLISEETLGMISAVSVDFEAEFWLETIEDGCEIHLAADTYIDYDKKQQFIDISSKKKNDAAKGFMGKIWDVIQNGLLSIDEVGKVEAEYGCGAIMFGALGVCGAEQMATYPTTWSLEQYRESIEDMREDEDAAKEAWDELEKSIVANLADDIKVFITGDRVEMAIVYKKK